MTQVDLTVAGNHRRRRRAGQKGAEIFEFTLVLPLLLAFTFVVMDIAFAVFAKATLQDSVRQACRYGVTNAVPNGSNLTAEIKNRVKYYSLGLLNTPANQALVHVHYYRPADPECTGSCPVTEVTTAPDGNAGGNIIIVSVDGYSILPLFPRIFGWDKKPDGGPTTITVSSADRIEPIRSTSLPPIGPAP